MHRRKLMASGGLGVAAFMTGAATYRPQNSVRRIIDVHLHAYPLDYEFRSPVVNPVSGTRSPIRNGREHLEACIAAMTAKGIELAVVSGGDGDRIAAALAWRDRDPARFVAGAGLRGSADAPLPPVAELRELFRSGQLGVMGEVTAQYAGRTLDDPIYEPYLSLAAEFGRPVAVHMGTMPPGTTFDPCCTSARAAFGHPETIETALNRHPGLKVNIMHGGWPYVAETIALLMQYDNVNIDTGAISWLLPRPAFHGLLNYLIDAGFTGRIMFGTDQMFWPDAISMAVDRVASLPGASPSTLDAIFYRNAAAFYQIGRSVK